MVTAPERAVSGGGESESGESVAFGVKRDETAESPAQYGVREVAVAVGAGTVATVAMAPLFTLAWWAGALDPAAFAGLAELLGLGPSLPVGAFVFVGGGAIPLALVFLAWAGFLPGSTLAARGMVYATIVWTGFALAFYAGQAGSTLALYLVLTLAAHWTYGAVLGYLYGRVATIPAAL
jgi:cytochrome c oxidase subunit 1